LISFVVNMVKGTDEHAAVGEALSAAVEEVGSLAE